MALQPIQYEYQIINVVYPIKQIEHILNCLGRDGWELVNVDLGCYRTTACLKRQLLFEQSD